MESLCAQEHEELLDCAGAMELTLWVSLAAQSCGVTMCLPLKLTVIPELIIGLLNLRAALRVRDSGEAVAISYRNQPALLAVGVGALAANIWIEAGKRRPLPTICYCLHSPFSVSRLNTRNLSAQR